MSERDSNNKPPVCLTIAGLDPSGGAGIIADVKTFSAFGCFAAAAVASVTFQNTTGVFGAVHLTADAVRRQVTPVFDDYDVAAVKTGMLPTREVIEVIAQTVSKRKVANLVVDPVVRSTSGFDLIDEPALEALIEALFPLALLVTPNIPEAERIARIQIRSEDEILDAGVRILALGATNVLIKGGHPMDRMAGSAIDYLFNNATVERFEAEYIETSATHGTGCTLAAAITANLALGNSLIESVRIAKAYVTEAIRTSPGLGKGNSPINI